MNAHRRRWLPSPAIVVALVALVVSVGGNVTAAVLIGSAGIKDNSIRSVDVRDGTLRSVDVHDGTLTGADVLFDSLTGNDIKESSLLDQVPWAANASKLNGLSANQLVRATTAKTTVSNIDFKPCRWTTVLSKTVVAPTQGILLVWGTFNVDAATAKPHVYLKAVVDRAVVSNVDHSILEGNGHRSLDVYGVVSVHAGNRLVALQARACGDTLGVSAYYRSVTTLFVPFGNTGEQGTLAAGDAQDE